MFSQRASSLSLVFSLLLVYASAAEGQSLDISAPSPITASELSGSIGPRDIGDARRTDHFYAFVGNPGDLIVTIESRNLNGDIDVFTSVGLRPLLKFTVYAESSAPTTKSIFLRRREGLILRVEARTPNDDAGVYRVTFGGSFEALPRSLIAESEAPTSEGEIAVSTPPRTGRRVSSVGARIPEPEPPPQEVAAASSEPTPEPSPIATEKPAETATPGEVEAPVRNTPRRSTGRRSRPRPPARETPKPAETETTTSTEKTEETTTPRTGRRGSSRSAPRQTTEQPEATVAEVGPRLVIETTDGTLINKSMSTVRRVMVENGWVVVVGKDGMTQRILLSQVVRMSIAP